MQANQGQGSTRFSTSKSVSDHTLTADPLAQSLLNQSLREQLQQLTQIDCTTEQRVLTLRQSFVAIMEHIVTKTKVDFKTLQGLHNVAYEQAMLSLKAANLDEAELTHQFVHSHGLVLSPLNCSRTLKDINRIDAFASGLHKLIVDLLKRQGSVSIIYPACGPFAPLLLPLLAYYQEKNLVSADQLQVTFIDIQSGAVSSLKQLISDLDVEAYTAEVIQDDAVAYTPPGTFDVLLLESSHHGFSKEAHFSIAKQLLPFLKESGVMLPCKISIKAALVEGQKEFVEQWREQGVNEQIRLSEAVLNHRYELGEVFSLDKNSILEAQTLPLPDGGQVVKCNTLTLPKNDGEALDKRILIIYSEFVSYDGEALNQYFSGITSPLPDMSVCIDFIPKSPMPDDLYLNSGDRIDYFYKLNGLTGFMPIKGAP